MFLFYEQLADIYGRVPDFAKAEEIGQRSVKLLRTLHAGALATHEMQQIQLQLARSIRNLGIALEMQHKLAKAELAFQQSLAILQALHTSRTARRLSIGSAVATTNRENEPTPSISVFALPVQTSTIPVTAASKEKIQKEYDADMASKLSIIKLIEPPVAVHIVDYPHNISAFRYGICTSSSRSGD